MSRTNRRSRPTHRTRHARRTKPRPIAWAEAKERFLLHLRARNLGARSAYCYGLEVARLAAHLGPRVAGPGAVTTEDLRRYQAGLLSGEAARSRRPLAASNVYRVASVLATFFRWLRDEGLAAEDPTARLERVKTSEPPPLPALTLKETERLFAAAEGAGPLGHRDRALLELLYATGLRRAEALALDLSDLDLEERLVSVRHGKGDKGRVVPLTRAASLRLEAYLAEGRPALARGGGELALFLTQWGRRVGPATLARLLQRLAAAAGVKKATTPHTLRRTFATHLLRNKVNLRAIQLLLGHEKLSTTARYLSLDPEELRRELLLHHPRERLAP